MIFHENGVLEAQVTVFLEIMFQNFNISYVCGFRELVLGKGGSIFFSQGHTKKNCETVKIGFQTSITLSTSNTNIPLVSLKHYQYKY